MREMQEYKIDFGFHSRSHYMMTQLTEDRIEEEITIPYNAAGHNGVNIKKIFCYPDGKFSDIIIRCLKKNGFAGATTLKTGFNDIRTDPYKLRRFMVHEGSAATLPHFIYNLIK
jgi:hypothetical protein